MLSIYPSPWIEEKAQSLHSKIPPGSGLFSFSELRASYLLSRHSTTSALFALVIFQTGSHGFLHPTYDL
jgi:hypothetical protein